MKRVIARLAALPIFLLGIGGGVELDPEEEGASPDESWRCDGPRTDLSLAARARAVGDRMRIDLEFENGTAFPVRLVSLGRGGRYEWGNDPNEPPPVESSVRAPEGWYGSFGYQFEGVMMLINWSTPDRGKDVAPGGRLEGLSFEMRGETLPPSDLPFEVVTLEGCLWSRWTLDTAGSE